MMFVQLVITLSGTALIAAEHNELANATVEHNQIGLCFRFYIDTQGSES